MGWVTLTARKKALKAEHSQLQLRNLQISSQKRRLLREKMLETTYIDTQKNEQLSPVKLNYKENINKLEQYKTELNTYLNKVKSLQDSEISGDGKTLAYEVDDKDEANAIFFGSEDDKNQLLYIKIDNETANDGNADYYGANLTNYKDDSDGCTYLPVSPELLEEDQNGSVKLKLDENSCATYTNSSGETIKYQLTNSDVYSKDESTSSEYDLVNSGVSKDNYSYGCILTMPEAPSGFSNISNLSCSYNGDIDEFISSLETNVNSILSSISTEKTNQQYLYEEEVNDIKTYWETESELAETEASEEETTLDEEQAELEAEMESVSQELQSVNDAISSEIQNSVIKLA